MVPRRTPFETYHNALEHAALPAHRAGAFPEAPARRRLHEDLRTQPQLPQRRHLAAATIRNSRCWRPIGPSPTSRRWPTSSRNDLPPRGKVLRRPANRAQGRGRQCHPHHQPRAPVEARDLSRPHQRRRRRRTGSTDHAAQTQAALRTNSACRFPNMEDHEVIQQVFEKLVEENTFDPLLRHPRAQRTRPARQAEPAAASRWMSTNSSSTARKSPPATPSSTTPIVQRERLEHQAGEETQKVDYDFIDTPRIRHAPRRRHRHRHRPPDHDAHRRADHPRRGAVPALKAEGVTHAAAGIQ